MSDAVWSARRENKINTVEQLKKIKLNIGDAGQYQHDDVIKFIEQLKQVNNNRGVTYQSEGKDLANGVEYLCWGAKVVS